MPKVIDNASVKEQAIALTRKMLAQKGIEAINMREIAAECGVSVGTLYNYFDSKEGLAACVARQDEETVFRELKAELPLKGDLEGTVELVYLRMLGFIEEHEYLLSGNIRFTAGQGTKGDRHRVLLEDVENVLSENLARLGLRPDRGILTFAAEGIIYCSVRRYPYAEIAPALIKLLK